LRNLKRKQKQLSRKQHPRCKGDSTRKSRNFIRQQKTVAKIQARITNQRKDFLHKLSTKIISENQAVGIEDLAVGNLLKNHRLARHIAQSGWRMFRNFLEYKARWYGRKLYVHDRFYPSSRLCRCGVINRELKLSDRLWICKACGAVNSRDELAADNLRPSTRGRGEFKPVEYALAGAASLQATA
jgi:putative transposase